MSKFTGTGVALVTPFRSDLSIDYDALKRLLEFTADNGVDYYVVQGTTGENVTISSTEKKQLLNFIKENNPKKLPIMYGLGGNNTAEIIKQCQELNFNGIDGVLSVSPYYNRPSQEGIYQHFVSIADICPVPVMLYNVPVRTGSNMSATTTLRLARHPNIFGMKEASGDLYQCMQIAAEMPDDFMLVSGDDMMAVSLISVGAKGAISVLANAFPYQFSSMVNSALENNFEVAKKHLFSLLPINPLMYEESNPVGVKAALSILGVSAPYVRQPLVEASDSLKSRVKDLIDKL